MADDDATGATLDYDHQNEVAGSPRQGDWYAIENGNGGQWHIYKDGTKEWVANPTTSAVVDNAAGGVTNGAAAIAPASAPPATTAGGATAPSTSSTDVNPTVTSGTPPGTVGGATPPSTSSTDINPTVTSATPPGASTGTVNGIGGAASTAAAPIPSTGGTVYPTNASGTGTVGTPVEGAAMTVPHSDLSETNSLSSSDSVGGSHFGQGGSVAPDDSTTDASSAHTVTVKSGDTLSSIASSNGLSTSQIEQLNPQFSGNFNLIHPGDTVNLGGGGAATTVPSDSSFGSSSVEAVGPKSSSYPSIVTSTPLTATGGTENTGWGDGSTHSTDPTQNAIEEASKTDTNPLKIDNGHHS